MSDAQSCGDGGAFVQEGCCEAVCLQAPLPPWAVLTLPVLLFLEKKGGKSGTGWGQGSEEGLAICVQLG